MNDIKGKIKDPSRETLQRLVLELPVDPHYANITMVADGIGAPKHGSEKDLQRYLSECDERGIIPSSLVEFKYNLRENTFKNDSEFFVRTACGPENHVIDKTIKGGRIEKIIFETGILPPNDAFSKFKKTHLPSLLRNGYEFGDMEIALNTYSLKGYNEGIYWDGGLRKYGNQVTLEGNLPKGRARELINWFSAIKKSAA